MDVTRRAGGAFRYLTVHGPLLPIAVGFLIWIVFEYIVNGTIPRIDVLIQTCFEAAVGILNSSQVSFKQTKQRAYGICAFESQHTFGNA